MLIQLFTSFLSILAGYSGFVAFLILENYQASVWSFTTGLTGSITFQIHWLKHKGRIAEYYTARDLWSLAWIGFAMFALGLSACVYNVIILTVRHVPILPVKHSMLISAVWCLLTAKTGAILFFYARKYAHFVLNGPQNLVSESQRQSASS